MCEYCGCQEIPAIAALTAEHEELRSIAAEAVVATRGGDHGAAVAAIGRLAARLAPHTRIEEEGLFPAMAAEYGAHMASLIGEHRELEATLTILATAAHCDQSWVERLDGAVADLFNHILREQDGVFPAALASLAPEQWDRLDAVRAEVVVGMAPVSGA